MRLLTPIEFATEALLGRVPDDQLPRYGKRLATLAANMRRALAVNDDDEGDEEIVKAGDALMATLPDKVFYRRNVPQRVPHR